MSIEPGVLYVVATPIGNLEDLTPRARATLAEVAAVVAEDTRHTGRMLKRLGIRQPLVSLHEHNERARVATLLERLSGGDALALVSDAGTPLISDPGYHLVRAAREAGVTVTPVPGPSAVTAALSISGLPTDRFTFEGFLPSRRAARRARIERLRAEPRTLVLFESAHRVGDALADLVALLGGEREALVARELTKLHEEVRAGSLAELAEATAAQEVASRGELVLVVRGADDVAADDDLEREGRRVLAILREELPLKQAVALAARISGASRNALYRAGLEEWPSG